MDGPAEAQNSKPDFHMFTTSQFETEVEKTGVGAGSLEQISLQGISRIEKAATTTRHLANATLAGSAQGSGAQGQPQQGRANDGSDLNRRYALMTGSTGADEPVKPQWWQMLLHAPGIHAHHLFRVERMQLRVEVLHACLPRIQRKDAQQHDRVLKQFRGEDCHEQRQGLGVEQGFSPEGDQICPDGVWGRARSHHQATSSGWTFRSHRWRTK